MSEQEKFLARWSRRKRGAVEEGAVEKPRADAPAEAAPPAAKAEAPAFDVSTLPPLDSIGASSDIRAFLQAGVPSALRHAALRRAWPADPAIRDYIGPNENFWDHAGVSGAPGFGDLDPNLDVKKLVAEVFGEKEPGVAADSKPPAEHDAFPAATAASESRQGEAQPSTTQADALLQRDANVASHHDEPQQKTAATRSRRHGGAMPE